MLFLLSGNKKERKEQINQIIIEHGGAPSAVNRINFEDLSADQELSDLVVTQAGLFGDKEFFVLSDMARELALRDLLAEYAESPNIIIFSEATITKKILGEFERVEFSYHELSPEPKEQKSSFNVFSLADALGNRDKKNLWLLYRQALRNSSTEEINGILLWQLKNMALVASSKEIPAGMKPFVFSKNQRFVKNYSLAEIKGLIKKFTQAFHNRDVYNTLDVQVEKIILGL